MDIANAKFFVFHDMNADIIYTSKSLDAIVEKNKYFPIAVWGVVPTESGDKMISVEMNYHNEPILLCGLLGTSLHWDYFDKAYSNLKRIEL